jgi:hypothetical protein
MNDWVVEDPRIVIQNREPESTDVTTVFASPEAAT